MLRLSWFCIHFTSIIQQRASSGDEPSEKKKERLNKNPNFFHLLPSKERETFFLLTYYCALSCIHSLLVNAFAYEADHFCSTILRHSSSSSFLKSRKVFYLHRRFVISSSAWPPPTWYDAKEEKTAEKGTNKTPSIIPKRCFCLSRLKNHLIRIVFLMWRACVWMWNGTLRFRYNFTFLFIHT